MTEFDADWMTKMGIKPFDVTAIDDAEFNKAMENLIAEFKEADAQPRSPCPVCGLDRHGGPFATQMRQCFFCKAFGCSLCIGVHMWNMHKKPTRLYHVSVKFAQEHPEVFKADKHCKACDRDGKALFFESKKIDPETGLCDDCTFAERNK